ncbi:MAG: T9SS type A sorting domain-containing protein [Bacteroidota bacterium]|nr:T9SS type A sorting domain-containing protein [Bacteroidota bacterium]
MKKKNLLLITLFIAMFFITKPASSNNIMGGDLTWVCIGQDSFMIKLVIYRDCNGKILGNANIDVKCKSTNKLITTLNIYKPAPIDITPTCGTTCTRCNDSNCIFPYGIEQYTFQKLLVLTNAGACCEITLSYSECCRSATITTGVANQNFYIDAMMNRCVSPCDNSPRFTNPPVVIICKDMDFMYCNGTHDPDMSPLGGMLDSLVYSWYHPLSSESSNITYTGQYSYDKPLQFWGFPNKELESPKGFHLSINTGIIQFRPVKNEQTVMAMQIEEYRNGILIGKIRREFQIIVITCPKNNPPKLSGPFYREVYVNKPITIIIHAYDSDSEDTILIGWNAAIHDASWTDNNKKAKYPTGVFNWTPTKQDVKPITWVFIVTAKDDACPINGSSTRAYHILVKDSTSSIAKTKYPKITLYPNPSNGKVYIKSETRIKSINLYNVSGKSVFKIQDLSAKNYELNKQVKGIYFLRIAFMDGNEVVEKLVFE